MIVSLHDRMDAYAIQHPHKTPLQVDPKLWEAFADDRKSHPRVKAGKCPVCCRKTRPSNYLPEHAPGTIAQVLADGTCRTCYYQTRTVVKSPHIRPGSPCKTCLKPLRPNKTLAADYPGTKEHAGKGVCKHCAAKARNQRGAAA